MTLEPSVDAEALVAAIRGPSPRYKHEAIDAIAAHPQQTTPYLLTILREVIEDPDSYLEQMGDDIDILYALVLLAHFREPAAHELLVRIARLPGDVLEELLGDFLTEGLGQVLLLTCAGKTDGLRTILHDPDANEYARSQAARALVMAVHMGYAERDEVLASLAALLVPEAAPEGSYVQTAMLIAMLDLHPVDYKEAFRRAWDAELIEALSISWRNIEEDLARAPEAAAHELAERCRRAQKNDVHDWLSGWACFRPVGEKARPTPAQPVRASPPIVLAPRQDSAPTPKAVPRKKPSLNGPCWCGSGKKYKGCHYKSDQAAR